MKEQLASRKKYMSQMADKRDLVNLDFYENEILMMQHKLNSLNAKPDSGEAKNKVQQLKHQLDNQKHNLDEFRKNFNVEEMHLTPKPEAHGKKRRNSDIADVIANDENFFLHLQSFENSFKDIRQEVLEFIAEQATKC